MLPDSPSFERIALNRTTFGARSADVTYVQQTGWAAWVDDQLNPPAGDDAALAQYLAAQILHIEYPAYTNAAGTTFPAVKEDRPLQYLQMSGAQMWRTVATTLNGAPAAEQLRPFYELCSAVYIRNAHSRYQLREVMADFWLNHFNVGSNKDIQGRNALIIYDREVIRPNAFGNFRQMVEAVATSVSMMKYLDNADSQANHPNENYARELMELHTLGRDAYLGKNPGGGDVSALGFTDDDIIQASRALSGWTISAGQYGANGQLANSGAFVFNPAQHNASASVCLGFDLSTITDGGLGQGRKVLDLVTAHPATATFICTKICRHLFGDTPPPAVIARAVAVWTANLSAPDQIKKVLRAILVDGPEIGTGPAVKVRRPHERMVALARTSNAKVNAHELWSFILQPVADSPFCWPTPDGKPDTNDFWLNTATNVSTWMQLQFMTFSTYATVNYITETPADVLKSATAMTEYWVGQIIGYSLSPAAMSALTKPVATLVANSSWDLTYFNQAFANQFVGALATAPEFVYR